MITKQRFEFGDSQEVFTKKFLALLGSGIKESLTLLGVCYISVKSNAHSIDHVR
jgi:hypothetical protein